MNYYGDGPGFSDFWSGTPLFFKLFGGLVFLIVIGGFVTVFIRGISRYASNNASDLVEKPARVVAKRTEVWGGSGEMSASTNYYVTFEFIDGARVELPVKGPEYGLLAEGDAGVLTHQGSRYKGFRRA
ncbi:DUF2500 domain-containing protein [Paenibacillus methanolicus]|uniref:Uncharacterized protein DUF2500 n=1 Tax=Paenibacillus methanolicus TaxID=582686 RepID=A0A5S5CMC6_9BACL|nr:DUF2500 domain-containing protein [Paenibacillus methanolicus]TYP79538.1 uncharacterized protein DUF2500 [Paenibacillus methanolicus]